MAVCFATLQQFSELENCFIDGTPLSLGQEQMARKKVVVEGWDVISDECGSVHDTVSESLDSETLRRRKPSVRKIASHSRWTGYSPDECYSPAFAHDIVNEYLDDARWHDLPKETPSAAEKVAQWISNGGSHPKNILHYNKEQLSSLLLGHVQDKRSRGRRSRSIILRFEEEQKQQSLKSPAYQPTATQPVKLTTQDSRMKRRKNMDTTSRNVGIEKPLPALPRKRSLKRSSAMNSRKSRDEVQHSLCMSQPLEMAADEVYPGKQLTSPLYQKARSNISAHSPMNEQQRPTMPRRTSKSNSAKSSSANIITASSPKPLQLVMKVTREEAEQVQRHTLPKSRNSRDEALRRLENVDDGDKWTSRTDRAKSENIGIEVMRKTLGLATDKTLNSKASVEQIETILRKPILTGRRERPRPAPIDMGAVLEANSNYLKQQITLFPASKREKSAESFGTPEEISYSEHPSALIPRPLSLPFRQSAPSDVKIMSPIEQLESSHDRLMRHRRFFDNRPLGRCLDGDGVDEISEGLFNRLLEETRLHEARKSVQQYKQRAFWDNVRLDLNVEGDDGVDGGKDWKEKRKPRSAGIPIKGKHCMVIVHPRDEQPEIRRSKF